MGHKDPPRHEPFSRAGQVYLRQHFGIEFLRPSILAKEAR
jgi:hypothetical protein